MSYDIAFEALATSDEDNLPSVMRNQTGVDISAMDTRVRPGDDFFRHANGTWIDSHPIPDGLSSLDLFTLVAKSTARRMREMIEEMAARPAPSEGERLIAGAYTAFMDTSAIHRGGIHPARPTLSRIAGAATLEEVLSVSADPALPSLIELGVGIDPKDPSQYLLSVAPAQAGLPVPELYLARGDAENEIRSAYKEYLAHLLSEAGDPSFASAEELFEFEREMAALQWPRVVLRDPSIACCTLAIADVAMLAPAFPLAHVVAEFVPNTPDILLAYQTLPPKTAPQLRRAGLPAIMELIAATPLSVLKAFLAIRFLDRHSAVLGLEEAHFAVFERLIRGRLQQRPRWERAVAAVAHQMPDLLGAEYAARHFTSEAKAQVHEIVENVLEATRERLSGAAAFQEQTRQAALQKLAMLDVQVGWSDNPRRCEGLGISPVDPLGNAMAAARWQQQDALAKLGTPVDRTRWPFPAHTVNASYRMERNQIILPAGILQPPFFDPAADRAVNYGAIGAIIGHEISHGFDDQGSKRDAAGALRNWWDPDDRDAFAKAIEPLVDQFGAFCPLNDGTTFIDGRLTLGENVSDLLGLQLAHRAYSISLRGKDAPVLAGYTGDQRFFLSFAQMWRSQQRPQALREQLRRGPHSPAPCRVNGTVRNVEAWYIAFGICEDDKLYLAPDKRVRIWG